MNLQFSELIEGCEYELEFNTDTQAYEINIDKETFAKTYNGIYTFNGLHNLGDDALTKVFMYHIFKNIHNQYIYLNGIKNIQYNHTNNSNSKS